MLSASRSSLLIYRKFSSKVKSVKRSIGIVGVPLSGGQSKPGTDLAPDALRDAGLHKAIAEISENILIKDYGNISFAAETAKSGQSIVNMINYEEVFACNRALFHRLQEAFKENQQVLTLGGDHSMAIGSVLGHLNYDPDIVLVWVDAHADINFNMTSWSGNIHGMPVSFLIEELKNFSQKSPKIDWTQKRIPAAKVAYIGLRDIDPLESTILREWGIASFGMEHVDKLGIAAILETVNYILDPTGKSKIHISFDIDALDPTEAPSTGTAVRGGLTLREGIQIMEFFAKTNRVRCVDLVEVNPKIGNSDDVNRTTKSAIELIKAIFGHDRTGNARSFEELKSKLE